MKYSLWRAIYNFRHSLKKYFLVMIQICFGVTVIAACLDYSFSSEARYHELVGQISRNQYRIDAYAKQISGTSNIPITLADAKSLSAEYCGIIELHYLACGSTTTENPYYLIFADPWYYDVVGLEDSSKIYVGLDLSNFILNHQEYTLTSFCDVTNSEITIDGKDYAWSTVPKTKFDDFVLDDTYEDYTLPISSCALLPSSLLNPNIEKSQEMFKSVLSFIPMPGVSSSELKAIESKCATYLETMHPDYDYSFSEERITNLKERMAYLIINIKTFEWIAIFLLVVVTLGSIGTIIIITRSRLRSIAIALFIGASLRRIFFELFIELLAMVQIGVVVGIVISIFVSPQLSDTFCLVSVHIQTWLIVFAFGVSITVLSSIPFIIMTKDLNPSRIIKSL